MACSEWKVPCAPVKPWQMTLVFLSTMMDISIPLHKERCAQALLVTLLFHQLKILGQSAESRIDGGFRFRVFLTDHQSHLFPFADHPGHAELIGMGVGRITPCDQQSPKFGNRRLVFAVEPHTADRP